MKTLKSVGEFPNIRKGEIKKGNNNILSSLKIKNDLNRDIWDENDQLKENIKKNLLEVGKDFFDYLELTTEIKDIIITGSLSNYNWSKYSDIDLHVIFDFNDVKESDDIEFIKEYSNAKKSIWNDTHNIKIKGFEVEIYGQDKNEVHKSNGIYSVLNNKWIIKPIKKEFKVDYELIKNKANQLMKEIDNLSSDNNLIKKIDKIKDKIKRMRECGLEQGGEYSIENLTFKMLKRSGYLKKLNDIKNKSYDNELSIKEKLNTEESDMGPTIGEPKDKHGYDDSGNENAMGWWGLEGGGSSDYSSSSFDSSSDIFDLKESLKKELRKYL